MFSTSVSNVFEAGLKSLDGGQRCCVVIAYEEKREGVYLHWSFFVLLSSLPHLLTHWAQSLHVLVPILNGGQLLPLFYLSKFSLLLASNHSSLLIRPSCFAWSLSTAE